MKSLHRSLVIGTTAGMVIVLCLSGTLLYYLVRASLIRQMDEALLQECTILASNVEYHGPRIRFEKDYLHTEIAQPGNGPAYVEAWLPGGTVLFRSPSLRTGALEHIVTSLDAPKFTWVKLPDGAIGRAVAVACTPQPDDNTHNPHATPPLTPGTPKPIASVVLARDFKPIATTLDRFQSLLFGCGLGTMAACAGLLWMLIGRILKPLNTVAADINSLDERDLSTRIETKDVSEELRPIVDRLNELLDRLQTAFERERSFSADVAHELRTPLSGLRSMLEVALSRPRAAAQYHDSLNDCLQITTQMQSMVENLLTLARLDTGDCDTQPATVLLENILRTVAKHFVPGFHARKLQIQWNLAPELAVVTDTPLLSAVVRNLLDNTLTYTPSGGWVRIDTQSQDGIAVLRIRNSGCGIHDDQADRIFERFWQADTARSSTGLHCGLGLSLVKKIVRLLGGTVEARPKFGQEFEITVSIPKSSAA